MRDIPSALPGYAPAYDGNGNITALLSLEDGSIAATYEYGPFGEPVRVSGAMAGQNPFRFSTKYMDDETGLLYYGYRYYNPSTGRWINRDPLGEKGGININAFVHNDLCDWVDFLGLAGARACNYDIIFGHGLPRGPSDQRNALNRTFTNQFPGDAATGVGCFNGNINSATNQIPGGTEVWEDPNIPLMNKNGTHNLDQPGYLRDIDYNEALKSKIVAAQTQVHPGSSCAKRRRGGV